VHFLRVFRCVAYIKHLRPHPSKLEDCGRKVVFIGYEEGVKTYRFYDPGTERIWVARDVVFDENARWDWGSATPSDSSVPFTVEEEYKLRRQASTSSAPGSPSHAVSPAPPLPGTPSRTGGATPPVSGAGSPVLGSMSRQEPSPKTAVPNATKVMQVEFATPLSADLNLDADGDEDLEHRYRTLENVLSTNTVPRRAHCDVEEDELHNSAWRSPSLLKMLMVIRTGTRQWRSSSPSATTTHGRRLIALRINTPSASNGCTRCNEMRTAPSLSTRRVSRPRGTCSAPSSTLKRCSPPSRGWSQSGCYLPTAHFGWGVHHMDVKSAFLNGELHVTPKFVNHVIREYFLYLYV
jgi:hypothetical protein